VSKYGNTKAVASDGVAAMSATPLQPEHAPHFPLASLWLCAGCDNVTTDSKKCPACTDRTVMLSLSAILDRPQPPAAKKRPRRLPGASCGERARRR